METEVSEEPLTPEMVPPGLDEARLTRRGRTHAWYWLAGALTLVLALIVGSLFVRLPYYILSPGEALPVDRFISIDAAHNKASPGTILLSTVALQERVDPIRALIAVLDSNVELVRQQELTGGSSNAQYQQQNVQMMDQSKLDAISVALRRLGLPAVEAGTGAQVTRVESSSPADGKLQPGDVIVGADAHPVSLSQDLTAVVRSHHPGDAMRLDIEHPAHDKATVPITLAACPTSVCTGAGGSLQAFLGVALQTRDRRYDPPPGMKVDINADGIGGPSAGLAFTLGLINQLSTGHLTGGHKVAVTGTIDPSGKVGPVGGVVQKTVAVERAGADYFLVPPDELAAAQAKAKGHHLTVIAVSTLDEAIAALGRLGGDVASLPPPSTPSGG